MKEQPMEQRLDKKEHLKRVRMEKESEEQVKQMCREGGMIMNRYDSQVRYCLNVLVRESVE